MSDTWIWGLNASASPIHHNISSPFIGRYKRIEDNQKLSSIYFFISAWSRGLGDSSLVFFTCPTEEAPWARSVSPSSAPSAPSCDFGADRQTDRQTLWRLWRDAEKRRLILCRRCRCCCRWGTFPPRWSSEENSLGVQTHKWLQLHSGGGVGGN